MMKLNHVRAAAYALVILALAVPAVRAGEPKAASVPFEILLTKHLAVEIKVNGKGPYKVIFDTGAPMTLVNNRIAKEAGLMPDGKLKGPAFFGMRGQATAKTLEMGDLKADDIPVIIMDHPALRAISQVLGPIDGIVGFPFFSRYSMTIDYQAEKMTFTPVDYRAENVLDLMMQMMLDPKQKVPKKVYAPAVVWGFGVDKAEADDAEGIDVKHVLPGSPAESAGLKVGDRLLVFDGTWTDTVVDCHRAASKVKAGKEVKAKIKRGEKEMELTMTPRAGL